MHMEVAYKEKGGATLGTKLPRCGDACLCLLGCATLRLGWLANATPRGTCMDYTRRHLH